MNNESKRFLGSFVCFEFLQLLKSKEERAGFFTGVCSSNFLSHNDMVKTAAELDLFNEIRSDCIGDKKSINGHYYNGHNCSTVIQEYGINKKIVPKICANCPNNPRYQNRYLHNQDVILAGMYKFGRDVIPKSALSNMTFTVFFLGSTPNELKSVQVSLRGSLYKIFRDIDGFSSKDVLIRSLVSDLLKTLKKRGGYSSSEINELENEIKEYSTSILNIEVTMDDVKAAYAGLAQSMISNNKLPIKITDVNMEDASKLHSYVRCFPQKEIRLPDEFTEGTEGADSSSLNNLEHEPSDDEYIEEAMQCEGNEGSNTGPSNVMDESIVSAPDVHSSEKEETENSSEAITDNGVKQENDYDAGYEYSKGIYLDRESYAGTFCTAVSFEGIRYALDLAYLFDELAVDVVSCENIEGLMIFSKSYEHSAVFKGRPVFIAKRFYSEHLFRNLFESHSFCIISMTLELLCERARDYNVTRFLERFSIRSAYKALLEENDEMYPIKDVFKECGMEVPAVPAYYTAYAIRNYPRLRIELIYVLDTKRLSRRSRRWTNYEIVLSSANHSMKSIGLNIDNLHRNSYSNNTFTYNVMTLRNKSYTAIKCVFKIGENKNELPSRFMSNVLNQVFNTVPFTRLHSELLEYGDDHLTVLIKTQRKENIVVAFEVIHTIIVRLCLKTGLSAPRFTDYQY